MSNSKASQDDGNNNNKKKRNLPSWMSSLSSDNTNDEDKNTPTGAGISKGRRDSDSTAFSKLMDGVVFVLSGFVNPERGTLRSHALEMGAEYRPDWNSDCTLLVCAYSNTPKFRQVQADNGTIVKKEWILECYSQKKLVEIDSYLMHAGKPWLKNNNTMESSNERTVADQKPSPSRKSEKQVERRSHSKTTAPSSSKARASNSAKEHISPSKVKEWAIDDLNRTVSWLESQEEKPEPSEIKQIAAEGILICLQDAIDSLEQDQDIRKIAEQWNVIPHAVEELIKLVDAKSSETYPSKEDLRRQAKAWKEMYEEELNNVTNDSKLKSDENASGGRRSNANTADYDSDETIEMTEEEIETAYNNVASKICK